MRATRPRAGVKQLPRRSPPQVFLQRPQVPFCLARPANEAATTPYWHLIGVAVLQSPSDRCWPPPNAGDGQAAQSPRLRVLRPLGSAACGLWRGGSRAALPSFLQTLPRVLASSPLTGGHVALPRDCPFLRARQDASCFAPGRRRKPFQGP